MAASFPGFDTGQVQAEIYGRQAIHSLALTSPPTASLGTSLTVICLHSFPQVLYICMGQIGRLLVKLLFQRFLGCWGDEGEGGVRGNLA